MKRNVEILGFLVLGFWFLVNFAYAKEITILYTGETHAMLYPCNCPKESDGGVSRRATLIKQLKKDCPDALVLDSGGFFAGGLMDEYTQNTQLDMQRTRVNLKAMELMKYNAVAIGDDEFSFGRELLEETAGKTKINFLSCNISAGFKPYVIREVSGTKIGIIGVTSLAAQAKAGGLKFIEPKVAVKQAVEEARKNGAQVIVLLSHLGESEDLNLINDIKGIDILLSGHSRSKEEPFTKIESTLVLRPSWQGRHLGKLTFSLKNNQVSDYKVEDLRLSDKIADDPGILAILPHCFADANCKKEGMLGVCQEPGTLNSRCLFAETNKVNLLIITPKSCVTCNPEEIVKFLKSQFPGLALSYLYYPDKKAAKLIADFGLKGLPAYLLGKEAEKEKGFDRLKGNLEEKGGFYILKPQFSGISYFLDREKSKGKLDLLFTLYDKNTPALLEMIEEFNPELHFLAIENQGRIDARGGNLEVEDYLRGVCVQKYYPQVFWQYLKCRAKSAGSSWWDDCLLGGLDKEKIKVCARGEEGRSLLRENIQLGKDLRIMFGPAYLLDNQEVFSSQGVPSKEEFRKLLKK